MGDYIRNTKGTVIRINPKKYRRGRTWKNGKKVGRERFKVKR